MFFYSVIFSNLVKMNKFKNKNNHHFILPDTEFGVLYDFYPQTQSLRLLIYNVPDCPCQFPPWGYWVEPHSIMRSVPAGLGHQFLSPSLLTLILPRSK